MTDPSTDKTAAPFTLTACNGAAATIVPAFGGIVASLKLPHGSRLRETLFCHDFFWEPDTPRTRGGIPFIFPICGRLERDGQGETYLYHGTRYTLPIHGFASRMPWHVVQHDRPDCLVLGLTDTQQTRAMYPFSFALRMAYRLEPEGLVCEHTYTNRGANAMPFYAGFHPYFLTPPPDHGKADVLLEMDARGALAYNEQLTDIVGARPVPPMPIAITSPAINELLTMPAPATGATLRFPDGHALHVCARGVERPGVFTYLQYYTMADQPFFCIEPWMGHPNALNSVDGATWLAPGEVMHTVFTVRAVDMPSRHA